MRIIYSFVLALFLTPIFGISQIYDPVDWSFSKQKISENTYELTFVADIDQGWAIYSNDIYNNDIDCDVEICPLPVSFEFDKDNDLESYYLIGDINVTSPTGLPQLKDLTGHNLATYFWDEARKLK